MRVSHETIYRSLFIQARGVLKKELVQHLRSKRLIRRAPCTPGLAEESQGQIVDAISIQGDGLPEIEDRAIPGHWEGDLLAGTSNSHIATPRGGTTFAFYLHPGQSATAKTRQRSLPR